ncbi:hypothetical protein GCM10009624_27050 [Gordonia sinesedis]
MARNSTTVVTVTDDYSGKVIEGDAHEVTVIINGEGVTLDLSEASLKAFETAVSKFLKDTPRVTMRVTKSTARTAANYPDGYLTKVREWANANGHSVYSKGLVKKSIIAEYEAAMAKA